MRIFAILGAALLLSGCESVVYLDSDSFDPGRAPYERFVDDARGCSAKADAFVSYDIHGMGGTNYRRHRIYNGVYADCMTALGYAPRPWVQNVVPPTRWTNS